MELKRYAALMWRWIWLIVLFTVVGASSGYLLGIQTKPVYRSAATVLIDQSKTVQPSDYQSILTSERLALTYAAMMTASPVMSDVITNLHLTVSPEALARNVAVSAVRDTQLIEISVEDGNPQNAARIANEVVVAFAKRNNDTQNARYAAFTYTLTTTQALLNDNIATATASMAKITGNDADSVNRRSQLESALATYRSNLTTVLTQLQTIQLSQAQSADNIVVVEDARPNPSPIRPRPSTNAILGALAGFLGAIALVLIIDYLDDTVKTREEVEKLSRMPSLGSISTISGTVPTEKVVATSQRRSHVAEAYRVVAANIEFSEVDNPIRSLLITSGSPGEGKSTTVANLAVTMAQMGKRVIAVDLDLRKPTLHQYFGHSNQRGVTTALLEHGNDIEDQLLPTSLPNLMLLPSGPIPPNPSELITTKRMTELIESLKSMADIVIFDTPPCLPVVDASLLARNCDAILVVVRARSTRTEKVKGTVDQLRQSGTRMLGFILNRAATRGGTYYYYYYGENEDNTRNNRRFLGLSLPFLNNSSPRRDGRSSSSAASSAAPVAINDTVGHSTNGHPASVVPAKPAGEDVVVDETTDPGLVSSKRRN